MKKVVLLFSSFLLLLSSGANGQSLPLGDVSPGVVKPSSGCAASVSDEASRKKCALSELRYIDGRLNAGYNELCKALKRDEAAAITKAQSDWRKNRDVSCALDTRVRSRKDWLTYVASDATRTDCVLKITQKRVEELEQMQTQLGTTPVFAEVTPKEGKFTLVSGQVKSDSPSSSDSQQKSVQSHRSGKYYFEVLIDEAVISGKMKSDLKFLVSDDKQWTGASYEIQNRDLILNLKNKTTITIVGGNMGEYRLPKVVIGVAADLDASRLYFHRDGVWFNGAIPGDPKGVELKGGGDFRAVLSSSVKLSTLKDKGIVKVNFGGAPFEKQLPAGYSGFDSMQTATGGLKAGAFPPRYAPSERIAGSTQVQWIQRYWEWARSFNPGESPSEDNTGHRCSSGQSGPVWFLTGSKKSASIKRECQVPEGKILLVPVINVLAQADSTDRARCDKLHVRLRQYGSSITDLRMAVDGVALKNPEKYYSSTGCFVLRNNTSGGLGLANGTGYWVFLKPLKKGRYEIEFGGRYAADDYKQNIKYILHVQ